MHRARSYSTAISAVIVISAFTAAGIRGQSPDRIDTTAQTAPVRRVIYSTFHAPKRSFLAKKNIAGPIDVSGNRFIQKMGNP